MADDQDLVVVAIDEEPSADSQKGKKRKEKKRVWKDWEVETLISEYEGRPCLWDTFSPLYHDRDKRRKALQEIAEAMEIPKEEVTSKWNVLRAQFSREVHSELKLKSGAATSERYKSKWKFLDMMKFLTEVVQARKSTDNLVKEETNSGPAEGGDDAEEEPKRKKAKKKDIEALKTEFLTQAVQVFKEPTEKVSIGESTSDKFSAYIAQKLNSFSPSQRVLAEKKISDVIFDIEIGAMETPTPSHISWSSNRMHVYPHQTISSRSSSASDSSFEAASPLLQRQTFYQENQFDNMSSLVYPPGNRVKSPANRLFTLNNHVPEEMRDATYAENENGQGIYFNMTSRQNSK